MAKRRLPPPERNPRAMRGPMVTGYEVGSWCPTPDGSGLPIAVGISFHIADRGDIVLRLKSPAAVDTMIQSLLRHKRDVWPDAT